MIGQNILRGRACFFAFALGGTIACLLLAVTASAQLTEHKTIITFSAPFEVPGSAPQVLPAGTYTFKVVDSKVNRNIVQVSNKDENHVYTTILAIPIHREEASSKTIMTFEERAAGQPQALRAWFYPNEKNGQEFVYSRAKATSLAKASNSPVPFSDSDANSPEPVITTTTASVGAPPAPQSSTIQSMLPTGQAVTQNAPFTQQALATPPAPIQAQPRSESREAVPASVPSGRLPNTSSPLPLLALIGFSLISVGVSIRKWRVR